MPVPSWSLGARPAPQSEELQSAGLLGSGAGEPTGVGAGFDGVPAKGEPVPDGRAKLSGDPCLACKESQKKSGPRLVLCWTGLDFVRYEPAMDRYLPHTPLELVVSQTIGAISPIKLEPEITAGSVGRGLTASTGSSRLSRLSGTKPGRAVAASVVQKVLRDPGAFGRGSPGSRRVPVRRAGIRVDDDVRGSIQQGVLRSSVGQFRGAAHRLGMAGEPVPQLFRSCVTLLAEEEVTDTKGDQGSKNGGEDQPDVQQHENDKQRHENRRTDQEILEESHSSSLAAEAGDFVVAPGTVLTVE